MDTDIKKLIVNVLAQSPCSLMSLAIPPCFRILMLGPHPDDFDSVGVTLRLLKENANRIDAGVGRSVTGIEDSYHPSLTPEMKAQIRENEQRTSCLSFGLPMKNLTFLDLEEDEEGPVNSSKNTDDLRKYLLPRQPDIVFLPHGNDTNGGHRSVYAMVSKLTPELGKPLALFLSMSPRTVDMRIDAYTQFGEDEANWKGHLLRIHDSQHQRNLNTRGHGFDHRVLETNRAAAQQLSIEAPYAEAFQIELCGFPGR